MQKMIDGVRLAYDDAGCGKTLVLLHGFPLDRTIWDAQFEVLAGGSRVIRVDLRGSGESACGEGPALMETLAGDVFGLLETLEVEQAIVAGHSIGGYVALAFFRMYAERVAGLALIASHVAADSPVRRAEREALTAAVGAHGMQPAVDVYLPRAFGPRATAGIIEQTRTVMVRQLAAGAAAQIAGMKERLSSDDLLADIAVPVSIVIGENDVWIPVAEAERTAAAIADCRVERLAGVGHMPMLEAPRATTAALASLIARCGRALARGSR